MVPVRRDIDFIMKHRARQHSDDLLAQHRVLERFQTIKTEFDNLMQTVTYSLCPIVCCLLEQQSVQLACEEQEDLDRLKIAMYGRREDRQKQAELGAKAEKDAERMKIETERQWKNSHIVKCGKHLSQTIDSFAKVTNSNAMI